MIPTVHLCARQPFWVPSFVVVREVSRLLSNNHNHIATLPLPATRRRPHPQLHRQPISRHRPLQRPPLLATFHHYRLHHLSCPQITEGALLLPRSSVTPSQSYRTTFCLLQAHLSASPTSSDADALRVPPTLPVKPLHPPSQTLIPPPTSLPWPI